MVLYGGCGALLATVASQGQWTMPAELRRDRWPSGPGDRSAVVDALRGPLEDGRSDRGNRNALSQRRGRRALRAVALQKWRLGSRGNWKPRWESGPGQAQTAPMNTRNW